MHDRCEFIDKCGFFKKFESKNSAAWRGLLDSYCRGGLVRHCERNKLYRAETVSFSDEIMPSGRSVPGEFKLLG